MRFFILGTVLVNFGFYLFGELLHSGAECCEKRGIGWVVALGVHLLLAALCYFCALEMEAYVVITGVGVVVADVSERWCFATLGGVAYYLVIVFPQVASGGQYCFGFGGKVVDGAIRDVVNTTIVVEDGCLYGLCGRGRPRSMQVVAHEMTCKVVLCAYFLLCEGYPVVCPLTAADIVGVRK